MNKQDLLFTTIIITILSIGFLLREPLFSIIIASVCGLLYLSTLYFPKIYIQNNHDLYPGKENILHYMPILTLTAIIPIVCLINPDTYHANTIKEYIISIGTLLTTLFLLINAIVIKQKIIYGNHLIYAYFIFFILMILPNIFFNETYESFNYAIQYFIYFVTIFLISNIFKKFVHLKIFLYGIALLLIIIGISSYYEYFGIDILGLATINNYQNYGQRVIFTFGNPNYLGGFLLITLQLLMAFFFIIKSRSIKAFLCAIFLLNLPVLVMTKTKGSIAFSIIGFTLQLILILYVYIIFNKSKIHIEIKKAQTLLIQVFVSTILAIVFFFIAITFIDAVFNISIVVTIIISLILCVTGICSYYKLINKPELPNPSGYLMASFFLLFIGFGILFLALIKIFEYDFYYKLIDYLNNPVSAIQERVPAFITAIRLWLKSPIIGNGLGSFYYLSFLLFPGDYKIFVDTPSFRHVHNEYLELLSEGGILTLIAFFFIIVVVIKRVIKVINSSEYNYHLRIFACSILSIIISLLLYSLFTINLRYITNVYLFYIILSIGYILPSLNQKAQKSEPCKTRGNNVYKCLITKSNSKAIFICVIIVIISTLCWHGLKPYFMSDKGMHDAIAIETKFIQIYENTSLSQFEFSINKSLPIYHRFKNDPDYSEKIKNEKIIQIFEEALKTIPKNIIKYDKFNNLYFSYKYIVEGLFLTEYALEELCLSWQRNYIYALYKINAIYFQLASIYRINISKLPVMRIELLEGLYNTYDRLLVYAEKIENIIPQYRDIFHRRALCYFYQGLISHEINSSESAKERFDLALEYFCKYKNQNYYDLNTRLAILFLYVFNNDYKDFLKEFKNLIADELNRKFYFSDNEYNAQYPDGLNDVNLTIDKNKYNFSFSENYIKKVYFEIDAKNLTIEKAEQQIVKLAKSIGEMFYGIEENDKWQDVILWRNYFFYIFSNTSSPELKQTIASEFIKTLEPKFFDAYKKKKWNHILRFFNSLRHYGWNKPVDYLKYDIKNNRQNFQIYWDIYKGQPFDVKDWENIIHKQQIKKQYDNYLNNLFYIDILRKNNRYKKLTVFQKKMISEGFEIE